VRTRDRPEVDDWQAERADRRTGTR